MFGPRLQPPLGKIQSMELKHGIVVTNKPWRTHNSVAAVQSHLDELVGAGWTLRDHSVAASSDPTSGDTIVIYSFVGQREPKT